LRDVGGLSSRQYIPNELAMLIHDGVKFRGESTARTAERLVSHSLQRTCRVRVRFYDGAIDQKELGSCGEPERLSKLLPAASQRPPPVSTIDALPIAKPCRQIAPRRSTSENPNYGFEETPNVAAWPRAQHALDEWSDTHPALSRKELAIPPNHTIYLAATERMSSNCQHDLEPGAAAEGG
jgi:hypothetical protein